MRDIFDKTLLSIWFIGINSFLLTNLKAEGIEHKTKKRPNILICVADDASYRHFSANGCNWIKTPNFDKIASRGILFSNAYTCNAKSAPARACLLTGRNSWQLEEAGNHIGHWPQNKYTTYMEALASNGYFTGYTGKGWAPGNSGTLNGKPRDLTGKAYQLRILTPPTSQVSNNDYVANFTDFLDENIKELSWCFWFGAKEPHREYEYGSGVSKGGFDLLKIHPTPSFWPDNEIIRNDMADYAYEVEYFDTQLGKFIEILEKRNELENTIIVVTSDNGMPFPRSKGISYEISNHMPMAVMWSKGIKKPGRVENDFINFIDIAPTIIDIAGIKNNTSGMSPITGRSFADILRNKPETKRSYTLIGQERHDVGRPHNQGYPVRGIIQDGFLYLYNFSPNLWPMGNPETGYLNTDGSPTKSFILNLRRTGTDKFFWNLNFGKHPQEELYQINVDIDCILNLAESCKYKSIKEKLKKTLFRELLKQQDPRVLGKGEVFDSYPFYDENMNNFYEKSMSGDIKKQTTNWVNSTDYENESIP